MFMGLKPLYIAGFILGCVLAFCSVVVCAEAKISASVDAQEITIGDTINYTLSAVLPVDAALKDAFVAEGKLGEFEIRDFKSNIEKDKTQKLRLDYKLSVFKTGRHTIPAYKITYRGSSKEQWQVLSAEAIDIRVQSVLADGREPGLKPLKPKVMIWRDFWAWVVVLVLISGALWAGFKSWRKNKKVLKEAVVAEPAHVIAYRQLEELQRANLVARGRMDEYYEKLSGCLRRYLEKRFFLRAPWMSTEEFLKEVKASPVLNAAQRAVLKEFLLLSDLVKFARYGSSAKEASEAFARAKSFIDQTKQEENQEEKTKT